MRRTFVSAVLVVAVMAFLATLNGSPYGVAAAQTAAPSAVPRAADGHPDLSGVWWPGSDLRVQPLTPPAPPSGGRAGGPGRGAPPPRRERFEDNYNDAAKAQ